MTITFTDIFCGAGGSSLGLAAAGLELKLAANHWRTAIDTHAANFRDAEHLCADVNNYDMRRLPRTDVLWASPICTEISPAGGRTGYRRSKAAKAGQLDLIQELGYVPKAGMERTRATFHDVIRAAEVHRYRVVLVENVPDVVDRWELFDWWVDGMLRLGYQVRFLSVSSAHIGDPGNAHAPQWRDRAYMIFTHASLGEPIDPQPRPLAWCQACATDVAGIQTWTRSVANRPWRVGRYRRIPGSSYGQYWYTCPTCRHRVEPYIRPAASVIDWADLGERIGDRREPLEPATIARITAGLAMFAEPFYVKNYGGHAQPRNLARSVAEPFGTVVANGAHHAVAVPPLMVNSNHDDTRVYPVDAAPLPARTTKTGDGLVVPPMLVPNGGTWATEPTAVTDPMRTRTANPKGFESLVTPPGAFLAILRNNATAAPLAAPMPTVAAAGRHHALIVPYYTTGTARSVAEPIDTISTRDRFALVSGRSAVEVADCRYRMVKPRESLRAQRFPDSYIVLGNQGEQTMQAGNAVSANVAQWIGQHVAERLGA